MAHPFPNNDSTRFSHKTQQRLALDALKSSNVSETARDYETTRSTVYQYRNKAVDAVNDAFVTKDDDKVLYYIPVTKNYIKGVVTGLSGIGKVSERDIKTSLKYLLDYSISLGNINSILDQCSDAAHKVNFSYLLGDCKNSSSDECYHRGDPILSVADIESGFCLLLEREDELDHTVWEMYLEDLIKRGYSPEVNVLDGGLEMNLAYQNQLKKTILRYDHFHIIKTIKELLRFLSNKLKSASTAVLKCHKRFLKLTNDDTQTAWQEAEKQVVFYEEVHALAETLLNWLQYDVLQLQGACPAVRTILFDFIVEELEKLSHQHSHRIAPLVTTLKNNKRGLLDVVDSLNRQFDAIATQHQISIDTVWDICYLARFDINAPTYHMKAIDLEESLGDKFDLIEDKVLSCIAITYRTSSVIENLNSRLRPYIDKRKGFKSKRYSLIQFMLNHLPIQRTANEQNKGKSTAERFVNHELSDWMTLLGLKRFKKAA